jgi:dihydrofolate reductase
LIRAGLVDEYRPIVHPVALGGGKPYLPPLDSPLNLRLLETRQFGSGVMYLRYSVGI